MKNGSLATAALLGLAAALGLPAGPARAHETLHEIVRSNAIAVRVFESDGGPLGDVAWEAWSPSDPRSPWQKGRTDRRGWLAFVPDAPGRWRVRVVEETGHGVDLVVEAGAVTAPETREGSPPPGAAFVLRPLAGVAAIGAVFAVLFLLYRRRPAP
jgi:nickel transport protein